MSIKFNLTFNITELVMEIIAYWLEGTALYIKLYTLYYFIIVSKFIKFVGEVCFLID